MKAKTDPKTGVTTCELSTQDRKTLAAAKTLAEQLAFYERPTEDAAAAKEVAEGLGDILALKDTPSRTRPQGHALKDTPKPPADKKPDTPAE